MPLIILVILIIPSILSSNLIRKGFEPINFLYQKSYIKIFSCDFPSIEILSIEKSSSLIISSK